MRNGVELRWSAKTDHIVKDSRKTPESHAAAVEEIIDDNEEEDALVLMVGNIGLSSRYAFRLKVKPVILDIVYYKCKAQFVKKNLHQIMCEQLNHTYMSGQFVHVLTYLSEWANGLAKADDPSR